MNTNFTPQVTLTNSASGAVQAVVPPGGDWASVVQSNDTFYPPPITFTNGMDGTIQVFIAGAQDQLGVTVRATNVYTIQLDATPPVLSNIAAAPSVLSAFVTWNSDKPASSLVEYGTNPGLWIEFRIVWPVGYGPRRHALQFESADVLPFPGSFARSSGQRNHFRRQQLHHFRRAGLAGDKPCRSPASRFPAAMS